MCKVIFFILRLASLIIVPVAVVFLGAAGNVTLTKPVYKSPPESFPILKFLPAPSPNGSEVVL